MRCAHVVFSQQKTNLSHDGFRRSRSTGISVSQRKEEAASNCSIKQRTEISWGCDRVHPCCCLRFRKQTTAPFWSEINNPTLLSLRHRLVALRLRRDLCLEITLPEVRLDGTFRARTSGALLKCISLHSPCCPARCQ